MPQKRWDFPLEIYRRNRRNKYAIVLLQSSRLADLARRSFLIEPGGPRGKTYSGYSTPYVFIYWSICLFICLFVYKSYGHTYPHLDTILHLLGNICTFLNTHTQALLYEWKNQHHCGVIRESETSAGFLDVPPLIRLRRRSTSSSHYRTVIVDMDWLAFFFFLLVLVCRLFLVHPCVQYSLNMIT